MKMGTSSYNYLPAITEQPSLKFAFYIDESDTLYNITEYINEYYDNK